MEDEPLDEATQDPTPEDGRELQRDQPSPARNRPDETASRRLPPKNGDLAQRVSTNSD